MSATRRAEIGSRGFALRSWRAYGNAGMTAVMRFAEASLAAWIINSSSIRFWSIAPQPVWTRNRSAPRIDSSYRQYVSPLPKVCSSISPSSTPSCSVMRRASAGCERPENTISRFCGPRSIQWPAAGFVTASGDSSPGRTSSVAALAGFISLLVLLARARDRKRVRGNVLRYHRSCSDPCTVSDRHGRDEAILDRGPDVAADRGPALGLARLVREVGGDRPGTHVRVLPDVGVPDVREVRHLCAIPDLRVLDLHEGARLG